MRFALLQYPIVWADKGENLCLLRERLDAIRGQADIAVVPEMFTTGFCTDRPELAEPWGGETCRQLQEMANRNDMAIVGSMMCEEDAKLVNRGFMFRPGEAPLYQDKRHLYRDEDLFFCPAEHQTDWLFRGVRMRLLVCFDIRFPVWARQPRKKEDLYDVLLVVANWPEARIQYWDALVAARCTENQSYIVAVNTVGDDGMGWHYNGHSKAYDTRLNELAGFADNEAGTRIVELDMDVLHHFRETLPFWKDADHFELRD